MVSLFIFALLLTQGHPAPPLQHGDSAYVQRAKDTGALEVRVGARTFVVRVDGIECPESRRNAKCLRAGTKACDTAIPRGIAAGEFAARLIRYKQIKLEARTGSGPLRTGTDGRPVAYLRLVDTRDFGKVMIEAGHCKDAGPLHPHPRSTEYRNAERK